MGFFELEAQLNHVLEAMAIQGKRHFSPHFVCAASGVADIKSVTEFLIQESQKERARKLNMYFEVECPEGDSDFAVKSPTEIRYGLTRCHICGTDYVPDPNRVWIAFDFTEEYKEFVKKKTAELYLR